MRPSRQRSGRTRPDSWPQCPVDLDACYGSRGTLVFSASLFSPSSSCKSGFILGTEDSLGRPDRPLRSRVHPGMGRKLCSEIRRPGKQGGLLEDPSFHPGSSGELGSRSTAKALGLRLLDGQGIHSLGRHYLGLHCMQTRYSGPRLRVGKADKNHAGEERTESYLKQSGHRKTSLRGRHVT